MFCFRRAGKMDGFDPPVKLMFVTLFLFFSKGPFCREDALELSRFQQHESCTLKQPLHLIGIVRDMSDHQGMHEMFTQYFFRHPLYWDVGMKTYRGLGNRAIPFGKFRELDEPTRRIQEKNIQYNLKGWSYIIQGGVLIFDSLGKLRYAYRENYSDQLRIEDVIAAVHAVRNPVNHPSMDQPN